MRKKRGMRGYFESFGEEGRGGRVNLSTLCHCAERRREGERKKKKPLAPSRLKGKKRGSPDFLSWPEKGKKKKHTNTLTNQKRRESPRGYPEREGKEGGGNSSVSCPCQTLTGGGGGERKDIL